MNLNILPPEHENDASIQEDEGQEWYSYRSRPKKATQGTVIRPSSYCELSKERAIQSLDYYNFLQYIFYWFCYIIHNN